VANKKQQRRRQKERRHEYEEVWVDSEGNELAPEEVEEVVPAAAKASPAPKKSAPARGRSGRIPPPPSWRRVGKRALIFAPIMFITVYVLGGTKLTLTGKLFQTAVLLLFFVPFSYAMDSIQHRSYLKKQGRPPEPKQKPE
jgi:hypothetical protein